MTAPWVFISYSHNNTTEEKELLKHLQVLQKSGHIQVWDDQQIGGGDYWAAAIDNAINQTKVAILLITADFLTSEFINNIEVPQLLKRRQEGKMKVIPVIARDCAWRRIKWLSEMNVRPRNGTAIWGAALNPDTELSRIADEIGAFVEEEMKRDPKTEEIFENKAVERSLDPLKTSPLPNPEMVLINAGKFQMGAPEDRGKDAFADERPLHPVYVEAVYVSKFPITNEQYQHFIINSGHPAPMTWRNGTFPEGKNHHPVTHVDWFDAIAYCRWLTEITGNFYRLPTEAEWEKAARGSRFRIFPWGDQWYPGRCNIKLATNPSDTTPVDMFSKGASPFGLYDMAGNVSEWTINLWEDFENGEAYKYPYDPHDGREEFNAPEYARRVLRGASFLYPFKFARCSFRRLASQLMKGVDIGFRVTRAVQSP
jgi:formylglycine-generating enzyme required for sulfatase activity